MTEDEKAEPGRRAVRASPPPHTTCESTVLPTAGLGTPGHTAAFTASGGAVRGAWGRGVPETAPEGPSLAKSASRVASKHLGKATRRRQDNPFLEKVTKDLGRELTDGVTRMAAKYGKRGKLREMAIEAERPPVPTALENTEVAKRGHRSAELIP